MKKLALLALAVAALTATARVFTIELGNGDLKLDRKYLQYGSADLLGIECITAGDTGVVTLAVGKHMDAKQKIVTITPIYETNLVHTTDFYEYDWIATEVVTTQHYEYVDFEMTNFGPVVCWTNQYNMKMYGLNPGSRNRFVCNDYSFPKFYNGGSFGGIWSFEVSDSKASVHSLQLVDPSTIPIGYISLDGQYNLSPDNDKFEIDCSDPDYSKKDANYLLTYHVTLNRQPESEWIEHWHYVTNITQIGTVTNISWKAVNRTCYQNTINTNLTDGIIIHYLENPIRLFRNDYIRSTCPIEDETNPGIYHAIMKDEGAASIIL